MPALESFGAHFGNEGSRGAAHYDPVSRTLTYVVPKAKLAFVEALIRLANAGKLRPVSDRRACRPTPSPA